MKFAVVLLGLFAISAAVPQPRVLTFDVETLVKMAIAKAQNDLDNLVKSIQNMISGVETRANDSITAAKDQIAALVVEIEGTISALNSGGGPGAICAQQHLADLTTKKDDFSKSIEMCVGSLFTGLDAYEVNIVGQVTAMKASVADIIVIVEECKVAADPYACAKSKISEVEDLIKSIIAQATQEAEVVRTQTDGMVAQIEKCALQAAADATVVLNNLLNDVKQCA